jgi:chemotaxis protein histidine kinase CheA
MERLQSRIAQRRMQFLEKTALRLAEIEALLDDLPNTSADSEVLAQLNTFFHKLAGAGGVYEMEEFCTITIAAEDLCIAVIAAGGAVPESAQLQLRAHCRAIAETMDREAKKLPLERSQ